jgi:high-affinity iron transporter
VLYSAPRRGRVDWIRILDAFIVTLREGFEASLVIGLILAYLAKTGQLRRHARPVWLGAAAAAALSVLIGATLFLAGGELEGGAERIYEGTAMLLAAAVLTWMVFWMRGQAKTIGGHLREQVSDAIRTGSGLALAGVAFVGVGREGVETALFLFAATEGSGVISTLIGAFAGIGAATALGFLLYRGAIAIDLRKFFAVTGVLVIALAAYLLFTGVGQLGKAGGGEALELAAPVLALLYGGAFGCLFLRGVRPTPAGAESR